LDDDLLALGASKVIAAAVEKPAVKNYLSLVRETTSPIG